MPQTGPFALRSRRSPDMSILDKILGRRRHMEEISPTTACELIPVEHDVELMKFKEETQERLRRLRELEDEYQLELMEHERDENDHGHSH